MATVVEIKDDSSNPLSTFYEGRQPVDAVTLDEAAHVARIHGYGFTVVFSKTPTAAGDYFFHLTNDHATDQLIITQIDLTAASAETVIAASVTGTPGGSPTELTPTNRLRGSSETADATAYHDEDITGLTPTDLVSHGCPAAAPTDLLKTTIVLRPGQAMALRAVTGAVALAGTVYFHQSKHPGAVLGS
jgi:hypothetical protein